SSYIGLFGGIKPCLIREYPANGETVASSIDIIDYTGNILNGRFTCEGDQITILNTLKNKELVFIEYPVDDSRVTGFRKGFIPTGRGYITENLSISNSLDVGSNINDEGSMNSGTRLGKNISEYLNGIDVSSYIPGNIANLCNYFKEKGTPLSVVQVEITGGTYDDAVTQKTEYTILDVVNNGLNLGYYAFVYPEGPGLSSVVEQAEEFVSVYNSIKDNHGIIPNCKIMIDIEESAFSEVGITPTTDMIKNMIDIFVNTVDKELGEQKYVLYSSANFISTYYGEIDNNKYGLIVSSINGTYSADEISYPKYPYIPENYSSFPNNWGEEWTGVQFNFGNNQDYDIYKNSILLK
ncbi:MAG: hypothetical protein ACRDD2_11185, partial [Sarcina sp.]